MKKSVFLFMVSVLSINVFAADNNFDIDLGNVLGYTRTIQIAERSYYTGSFGTFNIVNPSISIRGVTDGNIRFGGGGNATILLYGIGELPMTGNLALFFSISTPSRLYTGDIGIDLVVGGIYLNNTIQLPNGFTLGVPISYGFKNIGIGYMVAQGMVNNRLTEFSMWSAGLFVGYRF